jgi:translation initiation factor IF-2
VIQERQEREVVALASAPAVVEPEPPAPAPTPAAPSPAAPKAAEPEKTKAEPKAKPAEPVADADGVIRAKTQAVTGPKTIGKIDLDAGKKAKAAKAEAPAPPAPKPAAPAPAPKAEAPAKPAPPEPAPEPETIRVNVEKLAGPKTVGKIELPKERERKPSDRDKDRGRRKRIVKPGPVDVGTRGAARTTHTVAGRPGELDENAVKRKGERDPRTPDRRWRWCKGAKRKARNAKNATSVAKKNKPAQLAGKTLQVTEFVTASELASMMSVPVTDIIKACFSSV